MKLKINLSIFVKLNLNIVFVLYMLKIAKCRQIAKWKKKIKKRKEKK